MAAYTTIDDPEVYFQVVTWNGNADTNAVTFGGETDMQPDLIWGKDTSGDRHFLADAVRGKTGTGYYLLASNNNESDTSNAPPDGITSIDSNGFTLGANTSNTNGGWSYEINEDKDNGQGNSGKYVAWCWKAGTSFSNDASATSVGSIDSDGSINTTSGVAIIRWSGTGANATIAHGIAAPKVMLIKRISGGTESWVVYHQEISPAKHLFINNTDAENADTNNFQNTATTSSVFSVGTYNQMNASGTNNMIAYCFAEKQGFSKFGKYTGNGSADGVFCHTGFKPAWVMTKRTDSTGNWSLFDHRRTGSTKGSTIGKANPMELLLHPDLSNAEANVSDGGYSIDGVSNGFKIKSSSATINASGGTYIYMAFAEAPFVNSNGVPCNAR